MYYKHLSLPFTFTPKFDESIELSDQAMMYSYDISQHPDLIAWLKSINIVVNATGGQLFVVPPNTKLPIHTDGNRFDNKTKLNFVFGGQDSTMSWYVPVDSDSYSVAQSPTDTEYFAPKNAESIIKVASAKLSGPCLINAGLFHGVDNQQEVRRTISLPLTDDTISRCLQWDEAMVRFEPWLL